MRNHTNQFKSNLKAMGRQISAKITYGNTILQEDLYSVNTSVRGSILKSIMKQLDIESKVDIPLDTVINCQIGILVGNSYEYLNYGNYVVYSSEKQEDTNTYKITCYDKMIYAMKDYENMNIVFPITIRNFINTICTKLGITFHNASSTFPNYDKEIQNELYLYWNSTKETYEPMGYTYRDVLDEIAQATGSIIVINSSDELEVKYPTNTNDTIDEEYIKDVNVRFKEKYGPVNSIVLSRTEESDNISIQDEDSVLQNGLCELKIKDNQILNDNNRNQYLQGLLTALDGLEFYINDFSSIGILYYEVGDYYNVEIGENTYKCLMLNDEIDVTQGLKETIYTEMPEESITDYTKADKTDIKLNQTTLIVDKQAGQIQSITSEIGDRSQKTTTITQDIDGIESKVDELEDLTNTIDAIKTITIENGYAGSDILELHIYGNNSVFSYLYPDDDLYPDDTLLPYGDSKIRFYNSVEDKTVDLQIRDVLRQNAEARDEVFIDYTGKVTLIRRINTNGTTKSTPVETVLGELHFTLAEGNNTFEIVNYTAPISIKYAEKNTYTEIFATKVEMSSSITQTANEINLEVSKKVDENEIISKINMSPESIQIEADKISLAGKTIDLTGNNISITSNNFSVTPDGILTSRRANIRGVLRNYSSDNYLSVELNNNMVRIYDYRNNGVGVGNISSTYNYETNRSGICFSGILNKNLFIGYKDAMDSTSVNVLISYNPITSDALPYIKNTSSGTLFSGLSGGGITVKNGLIKTWNMTGAFTGNFIVADRNIYVSQGLITRVDVI